MKELDDLIKAKGFRKGQMVKIGYEDIIELVNQRAIEELKSIAKEIYLKGEIGIPIATIVQAAVTKRRSNKVRRSTTRFNVKRFSINFCYHFSFLLVV